MPIEKCTALWQLFVKILEGGITVLPFYFYMFCSFLEIQDLFKEVEDFFVTYSENTTDKI